MASPERPTVLTIGGAMIDTIALIDSERIERMSMNNADRAYLLLEEGSKTEADEISTHPGGGAVNAAVAFARLGFDVATLVKLGQDARATIIRDTLEREGISNRFISTTSAAATGASVLISAHDKNAAIFTFRGANALLTRDDLGKFMFENRGIVYVTGLSNRSADLFPDIVRGAAKAGAYVAANPGIRQLSARGEAFERALANVTLLAMNAIEAAALVPRLVERTAREKSQFSPSERAHWPDLMRRGFAHGGFTMSFADLTSALLALGPKCVLITDGKRGAFAASAGEVTYCPALAVDVVGTAGAGDGFTATFTALHASGCAPGDALQYATLNAASVVKHADTQSGLLARQTLDTEREREKHRLEYKTWRLVATSV